MLLANQRLPEENQIFGGNNVSFEINFREEKMFKYVQMALRNINFEMFFFFWWNTASWSCLTLFNSYK